MQADIQKFCKFMMTVTVVTMVALVVQKIPIPAVQPMKPQAPVSVSTVPVSMVNKAMRIERLGETVHATMVPVYSEGTGSVTEVYVHAGQFVKAGENLITLEITSGGGEVMTVETPSSPSRAQEVLPVQQDAYQNALKEYTRYQKLYEQGAIARKQLESSEARLRAIEAGSTPSANSSSQSSSTLVRTIIPVKNGPVTIHAAIDGTITGNVVTAGSSIQLGQELMALGGGQEVEIVVALEQSELYFIQPGSPVVVEIGGQQLEGQVSGIYPEFKEKQVAFFRAHIKTLQPLDPSVTPGMSVSVHIVTGGEVGVAAIPSRAIQRDADGQYFVFLAVEGKAIEQQVTIGEMIGELQEITTPMPQDCLVITSNNDKLKNNDSIVVQ